MAPVVIVSFGEINPHLRTLPPSPRQPYNKQVSTWRKGRREGQPLWRRGPFLIVSNPNNRLSYYKASRLSSWMRVFWVLREHFYTDTLVHNGEEPVEVLWRTIKQALERQPNLH
jgi:hypothetical protein